MTKEDRYREVRRWYARDHGATTIDEILGLIAAAPAAAGAPLRVPPVQGSAAAGLAGGPPNGTGD